ncbi:MAG: hypothetical protein M0021_11810 [Clostridia bacterium]|nr:hypothetical protein [Clostridia bacterium]
MDREVTVSRFLPHIADSFQGDPGGFLKELRNSVREVRTQDPQLAEYQLRDLGLIQHDDGLEIKMYFSSAN